MSPIEPKTDFEFFPDLKTVVEGRKEDYKEFLRYVANTTGHASYEQLTILYPALCQAAMEWLLVEKKSVDFGFMLLHPTPHRANWKQMMVAMFPALGPTLLGKSRVFKESLLTSTGFVTKLLSGELLAIATGRYVVWGVETELKRSWRKAMLRHEAAKLSALGSINYAAYTAKQIVKLRPRLINAYLSFLRQISYPSAKIQQSRPHRRGFIVPYVPKDRVRAVAATNLPVVAVVPRDPQELATPKVADVAVEDAFLPSLLDIQPNNADLRVRGWPKPGGSTSGTGT